MHRRRDAEPRPMPKLSIHKGRVGIELPALWAKSHPLTDGTLAAEVQTWADIDAFSDIQYRVV